MVPLARHGRAPAPRPAHHVARAVLGRNPEADACGRSRRSPPLSRHRPSCRPASRASRRPPSWSRRTAPSCDASVPAPRGTRNTGSCAMGYPSCGSRPSRTAQPPLHAPVAGREPPSRKDDRGGTTAGTTGIASGFLTRINEGHSPKEAPPSKTVEPFFVVQQVCCQPGSVSRKTLCSIGVDFASRSGTSPRPCGR